MKEFKHGKTTLLNCDCMEYMAGLEDNAFDLAVVDPPHGIGEDGGKFRDRKGGGHRILPKKKWDKTIPSKYYFSELYRISVNQIIWGGNYFGLKASRCWFFWDKLMGGDFPDVELAWTSFNSVVNKFTKFKKDGGHIHPTQKPVALYKWIFANYAKPGQHILDTHGGSFSSAIAAHYAGLEFVGMELDPDYYTAAVERFKKETRQINMIGHIDGTL